jgi:hypothetical protein
MSYGLSFSEEFYCGPDEYYSGQSFLNAEGKPYTLLSAIRAMPKRAYRAACRANGIAPDCEDSDHELLSKAREHDSCANISSPVEVYLDADRNHSVKVYESSYAVYGSGSAGCLYDNGPHACRTVKDAIEAALFTFDDLPKAELTRARRALAGGGTYYFSPRYRLQAGADMVEVSIERGDYPGDE